MFFIYLFPIITLSIFLASYFKDRRRLVNGLFFNIFLISFAISFTYLAFSTESRILIVLFLILFIIFMIVSIFGIYALIFGLFLNAKIVMKKESRNLSNMLTLFLGLALVFHLILAFINPERFLPEDLTIFLRSFLLLEVYFLFSIFNFLMISLLSQFNKPKKDQDFIIVLGSRVFGDKVPPLLASRIDRAITFYNEQSTVSFSPKIIFSGGQGSDEEASEGLAMQKYALSKGIPSKDTIIEDKSVNTLQNMKFSKVIMDNLKPDGYKSIFVTNNYHVFRASIYARIANLKSNGLGSKTAFYFLPNALIREYIALVVTNKKRHMIVIGIIFIFSILLAIINHCFVLPA